MTAPTTDYFLNDMKVFLQDNFSSLQNGTNLFATKQPPDPDFCVTIYQYSGRPPVFMFGNTVYAERPRCNIRVRDFDARVAQSFLYDIWKLFAHTSSVTINGTYYVDLSPSSSISQPGGDDNQGRSEVSCNFEVEREI